MMIFGGIKTEDKIYRINVLFVICDFIIAGLSLVMVSWAAFFFNRWWIILFSVVPLALYMNHGLLIAEDLNAKGDENNSR